MCARRLWPRDPGAAKDATRVLTAVIIATASSSRTLAVGLPLVPPVHSSGVRRAVGKLYHELPGEIHRDQMWTVVTIFLSHLKGQRRSVLSELSETCVDVSSFYNRRQRLFGRPVAAG